MSKNLKIEFNTKSLIQNFNIFILFSIISIYCFVYLLDKIYPTTIGETIIFDDF